MHAHWFKALMAALTLAAATFAMPATAAVAPVQPAIKTIGVIVAVGRSFTLKKTGTALRSNTETTAAIPDWGIYPAIEDGFRQALTDAKYDVQRIDYNPSDFLDEKNSISSTRKYVSDMVRTHIKNTNDEVTFDAYIVVLPANQRDLIGNTNHMLNDIGLYRRDVKGDEVTAVFTSCNVVLVDARTFKDLGITNLSAPPTDRRVDTGSALRKADPFPFFAQVDDKVWADRIGDMTPDQKTAIQNGLKTLIAREVPATLRELKLVQ